MCCPQIHTSVVCCFFFLLCGSCFELSLIFTNLQSKPLFITSWANSADDDIFLFSFFSQKINLDVKHCEMTNAVSEKKITNYFKMSSAELFTKKAMR